MIAETQQRRQQRRRFTALYAGKIDRYGRQEYIADGRIVKYRAAEYFSCRSPLEELFNILTPLVLTYHATLQLVECEVNTIYLFIFSLYVNDIFTLPIRLYGYRFYCSVPSKLLNNDKCIIIQSLT